MRSEISSSVLALLVVCLSSLSTAAIITVDDNGPADCNTIQAAIDLAVNGDTVLVADGIYSGNGNRDIDFKGKAITVQSVNPSDPNVVANTVVDCKGSQAEPHRAFYFHNYENSSSILKGFTIKNGYSTGKYWWQSSGGAILCHHASPTISYCRFINNAAYEGGGLFFWDSSSTLSYCEIIGNYSYNLNYGTGGGIYCREANMLLEHCLISNNQAAMAGGGVFESNDIVLKDCTIELNQNGGISGTTMNLYNCIIRDNIGLGSYYGSGSGVNFQYGIIKNCVFYGNLTSGFGAGLVVRGCDGGPPDPLIINCTFSNNSATMGAGAAASAGGSGCDPVFRNCIVWNNQPDDDPGIDYFVTSKCGVPTARIRYSILQADWTTRLQVENSSVVDPLFIDPNNGDFHLKSQQGRWQAFSQQWVKDAVTSPGVDFGDPNDDYSNELWPHGKRINAGAYGNTPEASLSVVSKGNIADLDADDHVNLNDFTLFTQNWESLRIPNKSDFTRDNAIDLADLSIFAQNWLRYNIDPSLTLNKTGYAINEPIAVSFINMPGNQYDWIGLCDKGASVEPWAGAVMQWNYTDGTQTGTAGIINGTIQFSGLQTGDYEARLFLGDTYTILDRAFFSVK